MSEYIKYMGRIVRKEGFRVYVYSNEGESKLANSHDEYIKLVESGIWFDEIKIFEPTEKNTKAKAKKVNNADSAGLS